MLFGGRAFGGARSGGGVTKYLSYRVSHNNKCRALAGTEYDINISSAQQHIGGAAKISLHGKISSGGFPEKPAAAALKRAYGEKQGRRFAAHNNKFQ